MKKLNFEDSLKRLEEITEKMENQDITLDESLKIFEEGITLSRFCEKKLSEAEQKLEILKSTDMDELLEKNDEEEILDEDKKPKKVKKKVLEDDNIVDGKSKKDSFLF